MTNKTRKIAIIATAVLVLAALCPGQIFAPRAVSGNITATNSGCTPTACVQIYSSPEGGTVTWAITGTFTATLTFEATVDGTNWFAWSAMTTGSGTTRNYTAAATAPGIFQMNAAGFSAVRARCSAYTSGTAVVLAKNSRAQAAP